MHVQISFFLIRTLAAAVLALLAGDLHRRAQPLLPLLLRALRRIALRGDPIRPPLQQLLLEEEGVDVQSGKVDMSRYGWFPDEM